MFENGLRERVWKWLFSGWDNKQRLSKLIIEEFHGNVHEYILYCKAHDEEPTLTGLESYLTSLVGKINENWKK